MGKGRWQQIAANRNRMEPRGQRPELENQHELSEPCALQGARTVHRGGKCREAPTYLNYYEWWEQDATRRQQLVEQASRLDRTRWRELRRETTVAQREQLTRFRFRHKRESFLSSLEERWAAAAST